MSFLLKLLFSRTGIALLSSLFIWAELTYFKVKTEYLQNKIITLKSEIKQKQTLINNLNSQIKLIQAQLSSCYSTYESYKQSCEKILRERDNLITKLAKLKSTVHRLEHTNKILRNQIIKVEVNPTDEVSNVLQFKNIYDNSISVDSNINVK